MPLLDVNLNERILFHFLTYPDKTFYGSQVAKTLGISEGATHSILNKLNSRKLLEREKRGREIYYRLNEHSPIVRPYKIIYSITFILPLVQNLAAHCKKIYLFGSSANGRYISDSDIDLAVICDPENANRINDIIAKHKINRKIQLQLMSVIEFAELKANNTEKYLKITGGINLFNHKRR